MMAMNTGGRKIFNAKPPDKGSFPLDHDGRNSCYSTIDTDYFSEYFKTYK